MPIKKQGYKLYQTEIFPLNVVNSPKGFDELLNDIAFDGWILKHIITTQFKIITIWEK